MKFAVTSALAVLAPAVSAAAVLNAAELGKLDPQAALDYVRQHPDEYPQTVETSEERFLIETSPGETRWVSEAEKWELRRVRIIHDSSSPCQLY